MKALFQTSLQGIRVAIASLASVAVLLPPQHAFAVPINDATAVTAGGFHACAIVGGGAVKCWGANGSGQLGIGSTSPRERPATVGGIAGVVGARAGESHTCVLTSAGGVKCWGANGNGQLGDGTLIDRAFPADVVGLTSGVVGLSAGSRHSCAVMTAGGVKCWGANSEGQLGDGTLIDRAFPADVAGLASGVEAISAGNRHTCALTTTGAVKCWGSNFFGALGDGSTSGWRTMPGDVTGLASGVLGLSEGSGHVCARVAGDALQCWGNNFSWQLTSGASYPSQNVPAPVGGLANAMRAVTGFSHTCALTTAGAVKCWGLASRGQIGDGVFPPPSVAYLPTGVLGLSSGVVDLDAGGGFSCAVLSTGQVACWGSNGSGELGDGTTLDRVAPVIVGLELPATPTDLALLPGSDTGLSNSDSVTGVVRPVFAGRCKPGDSVTLRVDGAAVLPSVTCTDSGDFMIQPDIPLADGARVVTVFATIDNTVSNASTGITVMIDTAPPAATLTCSPAGSVAESNAVICFEATDGAGSGVAAVECSRDGGAFANCTSPLSLSGLSVGPHVLAVRAIDVAGNVQTTSSSVAWNVLADTVPDAFAFAPAPHALTGRFIASGAVTVGGINSPAAIGVSGGSYSIGCTTSFTEAPGTVIAGDTVCVGHVAGAVGQTVTTTLDIGGVKAAFESTGTDVSLSPAALRMFASVGKTSTGRVDIRNLTGVPLGIVAVTATPGVFAVTHDCTALEPDATCTARVQFIPEQATTVNGQLLVHTTGGTTAANLIGETFVNSLVDHYYQSILRRSPDPAGKTFWEMERVRMQGLGANVNETWYAMATFFFFSSEYQSFQRDDTGFVTDLYNTFFNRDPDAGGLAFWTGQLAQGMPREVVMVSFMFSPEFQAFTQEIFGNVQARKEVDTVVDFYRGLLSRLPDDDGFAFFVAQFRLAQCQGFAQVYQQAESISGAFAGSSEYLYRNRSNAQYVGDLYNAFLRRGGDLQGVQFWINELATGARTRAKVRQDFISSPEFTGRVNAIIAEGCLTP